MNAVPLILIIVALVLAGVELVLDRGRSFVAWAVLALTVALLWGYLR